MNEALKELLENNYIPKEWEKLSWWLKLSIVTHWVCDNEPTKDEFQQIMQYVLKAPLENQVNFFIWMQRSDNKNCNSILDVLVTTSQSEVEKLIQALLKKQEKIKKELDNNIEKLRGVYVG